MGTFTGGNADEIITPAAISPAVLAVGGVCPSNAADTIIGDVGKRTSDPGDQR